MAKTLVIAEKPSVGQDLARVLPGPFEKHTGVGDKTARWLEGPSTSSPGPSATSSSSPSPTSTTTSSRSGAWPTCRSCRASFKLVVRDERSEKQMKVVRDQLRRDDVDQVVNACDAGREGELIFAYIYENAKAEKPVQRLWLYSMTKPGDARGLRPAARRRRSSAPCATRPSRARRPTGSSA